MIGVAAFFFGSKLRQVLTAAASVLLIPALLGLGVQTLRIEGAFCHPDVPVPNGQRPYKPSCLVMGFKQKAKVLVIDLEEVRAARLADRATFENAMDLAQRHAERVAAEREARDAAETERANHEMDELRARARAAGNRLAAAQRVQNASAEGLAAAASAGGRPDPASPGSAAEVGDGPGADADVLVIKRGDLDILLENTARLLNVHDWATGPTFARPKPKPEPTK